MPNWISFYKNFLFWGSFCNKKKYLAVCVRFLFCNKAELVFPTLDYLHIMKLLNEPQLERSNVRLNSHQFLAFPSRYTRWAVGALVINLCKCDADDAKQSTMHFMLLLHWRAVNCASFRIKLNITCSVLQLIKQKILGQSHAMCLYNFFWFI